MKKLLLVVVMSVIYFNSGLYAQISQKTIKKICEKSAKTTEKNLTKEGFKLIGGGSMYLMAYKQCLKKNQTDNNGRPEFIIGTATARSTFYDAAKEAAIQTATQQIAQSLGQRITKIIHDNLDAKEYSMSEKDAVREIIAKSTTFIEQDLSKIPVDNVFEAYKRNPKKGIVEVQVALALSFKDASRAAKDVYLRKLANSIGNKKAQDLLKPSN